MNSLVLLPLLAAACLAAPGGIHYNAAPLVAHAAPALTYTTHVQVPVTKTVHYETRNVVTGYSSQIIKPAIAAHAVPALHYPAPVAVPVGPVIVAGDYRQDTTPIPPPSTPCFPAVPGFPLPPGTVACEAPQAPQLPPFPGAPPAQPQPEPQAPPSGGASETVVQPPDQSQPPQDQENPSSQPGFPGFPGGFPAFPAFPGQFVQGVNLIPEQQPAVVVEQHPAPAPVQVVAPAPIEVPAGPAHEVVSDDTVLVENPEFRSAAVAVAPAPVSTHAYAAAPAFHHTYAAAIPQVQPVVYHAAAPHFDQLVTKEKVLAPVRTHTHITPQVTQIQPEVTVRKVVTDVAVETPVYQTPVIHQTHVNPPEVHHTYQSVPVVQQHHHAYAAPALHHHAYAAGPVVQKNHY